MNTTIDTDRDLVRRVQQGDRHAFDILVVRHQRRIAHMISRYIKSPQEIEDVTQETFIKAYRGIKAFREDSQFSTWLHRIGVNTAIDYLLPNAAAFHSMFRRSVKMLTS